MALWTKARKLAAILAQPALAAGLRHGVVAGVEHLPALRAITARTVLDVGANKGQFALIARHAFPDATIIAFEPLADERARLAKLFADDPNLEVRPSAVGSAAGEATLFVTDRRDSSSLLSPGDAQRTVFGVARAATQTVPVQPLSAIGLPGLAKPVLLKADVQGAERDVLASAGDDISAVNALYLEASFIELYENQPLITEVLAAAFDRGFALRGVFNTAYASPHGAVQADLLLTR